MSLNFNVFGGTPSKKTVGQVFESFTKDLKEIQEAQAIESAVLEAEIAQKMELLSVSQREQTQAASAIYNITKLFSGE